VNIVVVILKSILTGLYKDFVTENVLLCTEPGKIKNIYHIQY